MYFGNIGEIDAVFNSDAFNATWQYRKIKDSTEK